MNHYEVEILETLSDPCGYQPNWLWSDLVFLVEEGLVRSEWYGSAEYPPLIRHRLTEKGEKLLRKLRKERRIRSTSACEVHTAAYGHHIYETTECTVCGRDFHPPQGKTDTT